MSIKAFTLIELMVVVAVLTILVTISTPRLYRFLAKARQSEAKTNLGIIHTLQEAYLLDHDTYFDPDDAKGGGVTNAPLGIGDKYGYRGGGDHTNCANDDYHANPLGFVLTNCDETRYGYVVNATAGDFFAYAHAPSDEKRWLYPRCIGSSAVAGGVPVPCSSPSKSGAPVGSGLAKQTQGDAWCIDPSRELQNFLEIIENCAGQ